MEKWRDFIQSPGVDIFDVIEQSISLAHSEHFEELRARRDGFTELMFAPRVGNCCVGSSDKTNASSGVYNEDVEEEPHCLKRDAVYDDESEEEEGEHRREEGKKSIYPETDDEPSGDDVLNPFDDDFNDFTDEKDEKEKEKLLLNEIDSIKHAIDRHPEGTFPPEYEAMDILYRVQELNISVEVLKETKIGRSVGRFRKHEVKSVKAKAKEIVSGWKLLVDDYMATSGDMPALSGYAQDDGAPVGEDEVGLASPPFDKGFVSKMADLRDIFNCSESDLSAASGPSPASCNLINVDQSGMKSSSSSDQEQFARPEKTVARVLKVDKNRPVYVERKPDHNQRNATNSSGSMRKGPNALSGVRSNNDINSAAAPRAPASGSAAPRQQSQGGVRKPDARQTPSVGYIRPRVETTKPVLGTKLDPLCDDLNAKKLEASKKRLHDNYRDVENAKKQRTVRPLELTELPKGGPKAQRPGQQRGWQRTAR